MFKVGDKVFHFSYGWGEILDLLSRDEWVKIRFKDNTYSFIGYNYISFTEYTLQGFSQERPIELPEVGELCLVKSYDDKNWVCEYFVQQIGSRFETKDSYNSYSSWDEIKRIKILD